MPLMPAPTMHTCTSRNSASEDGVRALFACTILLARQIKRRGSASR